MKNYTLVDYIDIWGNAEEGYFVNEVMKYENYISISENANDSDIIQALINKDYLNPIVEYNIIASDNDYIEIFADDYPICALIAE